MRREARLSTLIEHVAGGAVSLYGMRAYAATRSVPLRLISIGGLLAFRPHFAGRTLPRIIVARRVSDVAPP